MKKKIDIEQLLRWTLCDEMPKGRPVSMSAWDMLVSYSRLGARIQTSGSGDGLGIVPGAPHPDAEGVAAALARLPGQVVLPEEDYRILLGVYVALDAGVPAVAARTHRFNLQATLVRGAILAPPEWDVGLPRPQSVVHANGQAVVYIERDGALVVARRHPKLGGYHHLIAPRCLLDWSEPSPLLLAAARAEYAVWHRGLVLLAEALQGALDAHTVTGPAAPARPWATGGRQSSRVLRVGQREKLARLPLKPPRDPAQPPLLSDIERRARQSRARRK